jgi:hypothetical protein
LALPIHNEDASLANLARTVLSCVDRTRETSSVHSASLALLLETLIDRLTPRQKIVEEAAEKTVRQFIASIQTEVQKRDDDNYQAKGGEKPARKAWS